MYERLADKGSEPSPEQVEAYLGDTGFARLMALEDYLWGHYDLSKELRFPFGNSYGWGYKYSHKSAHLCYVFFEQGAFTVTLQIGDKQVPAVEGMLGSLSQKAQELWAGRYPCGKQGGWMHYRVLDDKDLGDVCQLIAARKKPPAAKG